MVAVSPRRQSCHRARLIKYILTTPTESHTAAFISGGSHRASDSLFENDDNSQSYDSILGSWNRYYAAIYLTKSRAILFSPISIAALSEIITLVNYLLSRIDGAAFKTAWRFSRRDDGLIRAIDGVIIPKSYSLLKHFRLAFISCCENVDWLNINIISRIISLRPARFTVVIIMSIS